MILYTNDKDPAMRYESLYRFAFDNCQKQEDPWGESTQSNYGIFLDENDYTEAKISLSRILHKLMFDNYKDNEKISEELLKIEKELLSLNNQDSAISIIDRTIKLFQ